MEKNTLQDIVLPKRRLSQVLPQEREREAAPSRESGAVPPGRDGFNVPWRYVAWGGGVIALIAVVGIAFSSLFSGVTVSVVPKQRDARIDGVFTMTREETPGALQYEVMKIDNQGAKSVAATGEENVAEKASGTIVIYNDYSTASARLIKNTRFETKEGFVYRIDRAVVVPGKKTVDGKSVPGQIEAVVYADQPGEKYNIGLSDFTVPGLKGTPQYEKTYARSKTEMTGGFQGKRLTVDRSTLEATRETIRGELKKSLLADAFSQKPSGFRLDESTVIVDFTDLPSEDRGDTVEVREKGTLYAILIDDAKLASFIAGNTIAGYDGSPVEILNPDGLVVSVPGNGPVWDSAQLSVSLAGNIRIAWVVDVERLARDLAGKDKGALATVLSGYPSVETADVVMRPFWRGSFPDDPGKITVEKSSGEK